ncbi:MAG: protein translocase subunit SecD [Actinobacteria bacterium]|nr:protein translocase subunit SecD [Actinomycetota bacterium]
MRNTRPLWISVIFVGVLIVGSLTGFFTKTLQPTLGLDLEGGLSVILAAPAGTPRDVLNQALENIRSRVDAFGVGEPEIFVSGTNIEIQLPGLAPGTIQARAKDQYCLEDPEGTSYGCAADQATVQSAIGDISVTPVPKTVCIVNGNGQPLDQKKLCFGAQSLADSALQGITVAPKASASPSASVSPSPSPSASPAPPTAGAGQYCLTDATGATFGCFPGKAGATKAQGALSTKVTQNTYCLTAASTTAPSPAPTPTTSPAKAKKSPSPSASPSPSPSPSAFSTLSTEDHPAPLPCSFGTKAKAQEALAALTPVHATQTFCVLGSSGKNLGCYLTRPEASARQQETGQQHLLEVIGETARLEERQVQQIVGPTDPSYASIPLTCATPEEQQTPSCGFEALAKKPVVYMGSGGLKYELGPVVISGSEITKATAVYQQATQTNLQTGWAVQFQLDKTGASTFADITTRLAALPQGDPTKQIAIAVDRKIISSPQVVGAITGGNGVITGSFSEQRAKDLATQLNAGALPVELTRQSVQTVSPTLGKQSLRQGIVAAVAGLIALFLYLLFYYRLLGVVAWLGMSIWAILALALVSIAGGQFGYSLTLAGVAGLVISLGVTADSYIVFFERLKDEVRSGKTPRSAVQPAFKRAYRTIVAADSVTGIAAIVLYVTAVSSVKGFALTLGVATGLDLFVVYFFKRPTVFLIARSERLVNLRGFGLTSGVAAEPDAISGGSR